VARRPHVLLSVAMSVDGYIDDASAHRLILSGEADLDRVDALRSLTPSGVLLAPRFSAIGNDKV
jgi:riboflavin biosynthesis pyrimidine reductase